MLKLTSCAELHSAATEDWNTVRDAHRIGHGRHGDHENRLSAHRITAAPMFYRETSEKHIPLENRHRYVAFRFNREGGGSAEPIQPSLH